MTPQTIIKRFCLYFLIPAIISLASLVLLNKPTYSGTFEFKRNLNPISIKRDEYGIPTIEAKTFVDTSYGLGFAHAQDRLWSIYFRKLLYAGRLSEAFGETTLVLDKFMRSLSLQRYAEYSLAYLDSETREHLQAYVDGFNDGVKSMKLLPLEFWISWMITEPLKIIDVVTGMKGTAYFLTFGYTNEIIYARLEQILGAEKLRELIPSEPQHFMWSNVTILEDDDLKQTGIYEAFNPSQKLKSPPGQVFPEERRPPRAPTTISFDTIQDESTNKTQESVRVGDDKDSEVFAEQKGQGGGSNAWVIHGNYTTTGKPIIANDPHLTNEMPSFWYNAALITEDNYISGVSIPGCPFIVVGKTKDVAWGITANLMDTGDLYNITVKGEMYYYENNWFPMQKTLEKIYVKGQDKPRIHPVFETHHGVIIDPYFVEFFGKKGFKLDENEKYALAWMGFTYDETTLASISKLTTVKTADDMVSIWKGASQVYMNIHFATTSGDIGFLVLGKLPIRSSVSKGIRPLDGSLKENDWLGWVPWEDQPRVINPKKGYIVSANNKVAVDNVKWQVSYRSISTPRAARINEMISEFITNNKKISVEDVKKMQLDVLDVVAREATPVIVKCAREAVRLGYQTTLIDNSQLEKILSELEKWDYRMEKESVAAAILAVWELLFKHKTLLGSDIPEEPRKTFVNETIYDNFIYKKIISWSSLDPALFDEYWCHSDETKGKSNPCLYNLVKALEDTWVYLEKNVGKEFEAWQWQKIHSNEYPHIPYSGSAVGRFFHRSHPSAGNARTVKVSITPKGKFDGAWSPNMRMVMSLDGKDDSYAIIDTGVSGSPNSDHYDDQMKAYQEGKWIKMQESKRESWKDKVDFVFKY